MQRLVSVAQRYATRFPDELRAGANSPARNHRRGSLNEATSASWPEDSSAYQGAIIDALTAYDGCPIGNRDFLLELVEVVKDAAPRDAKEASKSTPRSRQWSGSDCRELLQHFNFWHLGRVRNRKRRSDCKVMHLISRVYLCFKRWQASWKKDFYFGRKTGDPKLLSGMGKGAKVRALECFRDCRVCGGQHNHLCSLRKRKNQPHLTISNFTRLPLTAILLKRFNPRPPVASSRPTDLAHIRDDCACRCPSLRGGGLTWLVNHRQRRIRRQGMASRV